MFGSFEEKGKIFTQVISKIPVRVLIQTTHQLIRGMMHIRPDSRIKDELNEPELFVAITEVEILNEQNEVVQTSPFMALSRSQIIWVLPLPSQAEGESEE